jgi:osmotically-inducible protein OsmY
MADASIDSTSIDVDTNADTKTVTLRGRVRTAAEKTKAASIAADKAPGYRVTNNLEVGR